MTTPPAVLEAIVAEELGFFDDARGRLWKIFENQVEGEVYAITLVAGASRGHHLHRLATETFAGLAGRALLVVVDPASGDRRVIPLEGRRVRVPPGIAHAIFAASDGPDGLVVAAMDRRHDPSDVVPFRVAAP
jgi:oxalate decarboxylase/phosphoglucose isomerase-like protein (cupin superfamily)